MNTIRITGRLIRNLMGMLALLLLGCGVASAQKKDSSPAPAKSAPAPAKSAPAKAAPSGSASHGTSTAAGHGTSTAGGSHGPSTAAHGPTTAGGSHGATTAAHGPTTAGGSHGATTAGHSATTTTGSHGATTAGHSASTGGSNANKPGGSKKEAVGGHDPSASKNAATAGNKAGGKGPQPKGSHTAHDAKGNEVRTRANGRPADVHNASRGMDIHHGLDGSRRVSVERPDHSRIVADRRGHGYVQHPYSYRGREYAHRTYYRDGRAYDRFYNRYPYRGEYLEGYAPAYYYPQAFYGWAYNPWPAPVAYGWGFAPAPWYGYYGGYFTPWPVYASASLWLTDYLISQSVAAAYQSQVAAQGDPGGDPPAPGPLTPEVKQQIADEVQRQIALENQEAQEMAKNTQPDPASSGIQRMLTDGVHHVFVAGTNLDVTDNNGTECTVGEGDALQLTGPPADDATYASLVMLSSKGGHDCSKEDTVSVSFTDLQDMQNHMRETIGTGMGNLQTNQGKGGLPKLPQSAQGAPTKSDFAASAPPPDADAAKEINQQVQDSGQAEQEAVSGTQSAPQNAGDQGSAPAAPAGSPKSISVGQTIAEVTAALGQPKSVVDLGTKKIYVYSDLKVTFKSGKVSDVQ
jgi:hypothetical protein